MHHEAYSQEYHTNVTLGHTVLAKSLQLCLTLTLWTVTCQALLNSPGKNTVVGSQFLFQRIFVTQGLNLCLLQGRQIFCPSHQGSPNLCSTPETSGLDGKKYACYVGGPGSILGQEDSLEKEMETHSSIPAWRIPWTEEPGGLLPMGSQSWT